MNHILSNWNSLNDRAAISSLLSCCASARWAEFLVSMRPFASEESLLRAADEIWDKMQQADWIEAFKAHPRIGERVDTQRFNHVNEQSREWSTQEQASTTVADPIILEQLAAGNVRYEERFGMTYIVCATGKSANEILDILQDRLAGTRDEELRRAAEEQRQIFHIRMKRWLEI